MMRRHPFRALVVAASLGVLTAGCSAVEGGGDSSENFPDQPITWIVPFEPGGGSDIDFRRLQEHLEDSLGVRIDVQYQTGADGASGWTQLANAETDGYTIGSVVLPHAIVQPLSLDDVGYQTDDFEFIAMNARAPQVLFVRKDDPAFETFREFEKAAKANPSTIDLSGGAEFNAGHLVWAQFNEQGIDTNFVPASEGATEVVTSVLGGHIPVGITSGQQAAANDEITPLAVFAEEEYPLLPGVPTAKSLGYDVIQETNWGVAAPAGTPKDQVDVLWEAIDDALAEQDVKENMESSGQQPIGLGPEETVDYVADSTDLVEDVLPLLESANK